MAVEWSGSAPDVLLRIDRAGPLGLRSQLEEQLRAAIRTGRLAGGERLPSSRRLAADLGLSRGLVQDCFAQLQAEGYLTSSPGSATRVAATAEPARPDPDAHHASDPEPGRRRFAIADFRAGVPDLGLVPREDWGWALREVCRTIPNSGFDYGDPVGDMRLRVVLAAYLRRVRAGAARADQLVICTGMAQALGLALRALAGAGIASVAFEDPGAGMSTIEQATAAGLTAAPVPVDEHGVDVTALQRSGARAVLVTPAHQWPTGVVLAGHRRQQLIGWAREHDGLIIEDDYDAEFRYDRAPIGALQGLAPERVLYIGSTGKTFAPGLRLGWAVLPPDLVEEVARELLNSMLQVSGFDQLAFANFLHRGDFDRHLRRMRQLYRARRDLVVSVLGELLPGHRVRGIAAGLHVVLEMPSALAASSVQVEAEEAGIVVETLEQHVFADYAGPSGLLIGYGGLPEPSLEEAIGVLAEIVSAG